MSNLETLALEPDAVAAQIAADLSKVDPDLLSSELEYTPTGQHSYYRDLIRGGQAAEFRLAKHRGQMERLHAARAERAQRANPFEFRVEPGRTDGQGGYFSPPAWLNELFATANRPGRVLAGLMRRFDLPAGVSQVNIPVLSTGTQVATAADGASVDDRDIIDTSSSSIVEPIAGMADVALQLLDLSPVAAAVDWALLMDLSESYDAHLEARLLYGLGSGSGQILGVMNASGINTVTYTDASPTGSEIDPFLGQAAAKIGDNRKRPPECWLMRTARWTWFMTSEDGSANRPFGLDTRFYLGNDDDTPDPVSGFLGWPVFLDDAIPTTISGNPGSFGYTAGAQDAIVCLRPTELLLLEGSPSTVVDRESRSGSLGARVRLHNNVASIADRRATGISVVGGTGLTPVSGF